MNSACILRDANAIGARTISRLNPAACLSAATEADLPVAVPVAGDRPTSKNLTTSLPRAPWSLIPRGSPEIAGPLAMRNGGPSVWEYWGTRLRDL